MKGQINTLTAIIGAVGMILASAFTSWASSSSAVAEVRTQVVQVTERENNHYAEIQKRLDEQALITKEMNEILRAAPWAQNKTK